MIMKTSFVKDVKLMITKVNVTVVNDQEFKIIILNVNMCKGIRTQNCYLFLHNFLEMQINLLLVNPCMVIIL
jgi:hypothetical protein